MGIDVKENKMIFSCNKKKTSQLQTATTVECYANQNKPECSLIEELREIQKELNKKDDLYNRRYEIMDLLYKSRPMGYYGMSHSFNDVSGVLYEIERKGCYYTNIEGLNKAIALLQEYKELTEKQLEHDQRIKDLNQRQKEIKDILGIK